MGVTLNYVSLAVITISGFFLTPLILSSFGPSHLGILTLTYSVTGFTALLDFGIGLATMFVISERQHSSPKDQISRLVSSLLTLHTAIGFLLGFAIFLLIPSMASWFHISQADFSIFKTCMVFASLAVGVTYPSALLTASFQGLREYASLNYIGIIFQLINVGVSIVAIVLKQDVAVLAGINFATALATYGFKFFYLKRLHLPDLRFASVSGDALVAVRGRAPSLFLSLLAEKAILQTDVVIVAIFLGPFAVAAYQVALSIGNALRRVGEQLHSVTMTTATDLWAKGDLARFRLFFELALLSISQILIPALCIVLLIADRFLNLWVGANLAHQSALTLCVLSAAMVSASTQATMTHFLMAAGRYRLVSLVSAIEATINVVLSVLLVHFLGIVGAAIGTLIPSLLATLLFTVIACKRVLGISVGTILGVLWPVAIQALVFLILGNLLFSSLIQSASLLPLLVLSGATYVAWVGLSVVSRKKYRPQFLTLLKR